MQNNYEDSNPHLPNMPVQNYQCTFNPINKIVDLFEQLLKSEREKIELLQKLLDKK